MSHLDDEELDALLSKELEHDPGEAYFASFPERVSARIAAEASATAPAQAPARRGGISGWLAALLTPRGFTYAGGTLALLLVAGIAYQTSQRSAEAPQTIQQSAPVIPTEPTASDELSRKMAAQSEQSAPPAAESATPTQSAPADVTTPAARQTRPARMVEVRPGPNGEDVPVSPRSTAPRPTLAPIAGESEQARAKRELIAQPIRQQRAGEAKAQADQPMEPFSGAPAPALATDRRGGVQPATEEDGVATKELSVTNRLDSSAQLCGIVRDASGRPIGGARVTLTADGRGATTDPRGAFCLPQPRQAGMLSVLAVGFRESRLTVGPSSTQSLAVTLEAIDPLRKGGSALGTARTPITSPLTDALAGKVRGDAYLRESAPARAAVAYAREAQTLAEKSPSSELWTLAGERWSLVAPLVRSEAAVADARYQAARARYASWESAPDVRSQRHAREAVESYLAIATRGPLRDLALGWKAKLVR